MRYAIYFTPAPETALWRFGSAVLGYDAAARQSVPFPEHRLWLEPWFARAQETPACYGFHATLKAPFVLAPGVREGELLKRVASFSQGLAPLYLPALEIASLGDFLALRPIAEDAELNRLAAACVREFDDLREPLGCADRERRMSQVLTPRQREYLERWGYPYVLEEFRFHMTLTGSLAASLQPRALEALSALYRTVRAPVWVDAITVLAQPTREQRFVILERCPLRGDAPAVSLSV